MTIQPLVTITEIRGGMAARAVEIGLAGHGRDQERAVAALRSVIGTWARCLAQDGELERTLVRLGVASNTSGDGLQIAFDLKPVTS